jgi:hypothetical protein
MKIPPPKKRLLAEWNDYRTICVPLNAHATQVEETRRAFYGGAQTLMALVCNAMSDDHEPTPEDIQVMEELDAELKEYLADIKMKYV